MCSPRSSVETPLRPWDRAGSAWGAPGPRPKFKRLLLHQRPSRGCPLLGVGLGDAVTCFFWKVKLRKLEMGFLDSFSDALNVLQKSKGNDFFCSCLFLPDSSAIARHLCGF